MSDDMLERARELVFENSCQALRDYDIDEENYAQDPEFGQACAALADAVVEPYATRIRELEAELAAREARGVRVKLLAWRDSYGVLRAETPYGDYKVAGKLLTLPGALGAEMVCESAFAARVAAQADYERRILAALEPAPVTPAEAARVLRRFVYETTHLSPVEDDGSHWCRISKECLEGGRAALRALADAGEAKE